MNAYRIFLGILICCISFGFIFHRFENKLAPEEAIKLEQAIQQKIIQTSFLGNGSYSGKSVKSEIQNLGSKARRILIPAGTLFDSPESDEQDLIITQDVFVDLAPNQKKSLVLDGYCTNSTRRVPIDNRVFKVSKLTKPGMNELLGMVKGKNISDFSIQDAIWSITDNALVSNIDGSDKTLVKSVKDFLYKHTKQPETWYTSPQVRVIQPDRSINHETIAIRGDLEFSGKQGAKVYEEICKENGEVLYTMNEYTVQKNGNVSYSFNLKVKGWKKGKYHVNVKSGDEVWKKFEFTV